MVAKAEVETKHLVEEEFLTDDIMVSSISFILKAFYSMNDAIWNSS